MAFSMQPAACMASAAQMQDALGLMSQQEVLHHMRARHQFRSLTYICALCRVLEQLIEARAAEQNFSSQLATRAGQVQQLACDRNLALQKLCHSEEKLVALEAQLISLESQLQERQEGIAAQVAALDVAALAAGPLAGAEAGGLLLGVLRLLLACVFRRQGDWRVDVACLSHC